MKQYLLGIDNGLTVAKAVIFDLYGNIVGMHSNSTNIETDPNNIFVEIDMERLWNNTANTVKDAIKNANISPSEVIAVANSAHGNGVYLVGNNGEPIRTAILPMDTRSENIVSKWRAQGVADETFEYTLQSVWAGQPAPILRWLKEYEPHNYNRIHKVLFCKDWLKYKLTGEYNTDYSDISASGLFDNRNKRYRESILEKYEIPEIQKALPDVIKSSSLCGYVTREASIQTGLLEGTPVAGGLFDVNACCIGTGVINPKYYSIIGGTWSINAAISENPIQSNEIVQCTIFADAEQYLCIDSSATSTCNLEWFLEKIAPPQLKGNYYLCDKIVEGYGDDDIYIIFLPYIYGSIKHPSLSASFINVKEKNDYKDLLRSVYEGIAYGHRLHVDSLKKCGLYRDSARFTGGASNSKIWCQIFSDVLGIELETTTAKQSGALGAAVVAGILAGAYEDFEDATKKIISLDEIYKPCSKSVLNYNKKYAKFKSIIENLK